MNIFKRIYNWLRGIKFKKLPKKSEKSPTSPAKKSVEIDISTFLRLIVTSNTKPFGSSVRPLTMSGISHIVRTFKSEGYTDIRLLAYALATCRREVGINMQPVRESFAKTDEEARRRVKAAGRSYAKIVNDNMYYGRGYVQLTHDYNYKREGIFDNPDMALNPEWAAKLIFKGLLDGRWNGKGHGLMQYLYDDTYSGSVQARRTVNVLDHANEVARYYWDIRAALERSIK